LGPQSGVGYSALLGAGTLKLLLEFIDTIQHSRTIFRGLYPSWEPTSKTAVAPSVLPRPFLAECRLDVILDKGQVLLIICPQRFTAASDLEPERKMEIPIDGITHTDLSHFISSSIRSNEDAWCRLFPELIRATVLAGKNDVGWLA
jgi:hypothetical protein